jgi:hypothetical membrane protein
MTDNRNGLLLASGIIATPLFFVVAFAQAEMHADFDLGPHMISQLGSGDYGLIQIANFVITGALFIASALGFRQVLTDGPGRVWIPRLVAVFGIGLIAAGVFVADPSKGYPVGAAEGLTWHGILHGVAAVVSGLSAVAALLVFARRFQIARQRGWAIASVIVAIVYFVFPFMDPDNGGLWLAIGSIIGWGWISVQALRAMPALVSHMSWGTAHSA